MSVCIDLGHEVVTSTLTYGNNAPAVQEVRITAPTGKKPVGGGAAGRNGKTLSQMVASYPDGNDWVFKFADVAVGNGATVDLYAVFIKV